MPNPPHVKTISWPATASEGDEVTINATLENVKDKTPITFVVSEYSGKPPQEGGGFEEVEVARIEAEVNANKADAKWTVTLASEGAQGGGSPEYRCRAVLHGDPGIASKLLKLNIEVVVTEVDVLRDRIVFDIRPTALKSGTVEVIVTGRGKTITMVTTNRGGGAGQTVQFDWTKFPQTAGTQFVTTSVKVRWSSGGVKVEGLKEVHFTGYGKFRISKYVLPNDDIWDGGLEPVAFLRSGVGPYRMVHSRWIARVRGQEGRGLSGGRVYRIRDVTSTKPKTHNGQRVRNYMTEQAEAGCPGVGRLTGGLSLARNTQDSRFRCGDRIMLATTDLGKVFVIQDTGPLDGPSDINHLDRYAGAAGPSDSNVDFPPSYVVKLPG
jgi:hypothetical protein